MDIVPRKNEYLLARRAREQANVTLMFLTGRDNEVGKILGLEIGADDYIRKPFNPRELTIPCATCCPTYHELWVPSAKRRSVESF